MKCKTVKQEEELIVAAKKQTGRIAPTFFPSSNITTVVSDNLY